MRKLWVTVCAAASALFVLSAAPAAAQATRTWVSGVGDDVNPCSRTAPCKTFAGAISKTAAGGEINALDPGGFGSVTITKSITIRNEGAEAGITAPLTTGIVVNAAATDKIVIDGIDIEGAGTGINGINIIAAQNVIVTNSEIRNFRSGVNSAGILVNGATRLTTRNVQLLGNNIGILVSTPAGTGSAKVTDSLFVANTTAAIRVTGAGNSADTDGNSFYGSPKALEILAGATVRSFGNNSFGTAATDAPTTVTPQN